ncbi:hypothetical protein EZS27_034066 [termite gut metagenome]|uniref:Uncharacterized protein n=1 Tax=termite gut metagenome TaxID=433724 RepID=A0A5J4Q1C5_9ZZZZ
MINPQKLIDTINSSCKPLLGQSFALTKRKQGNNFCLYRINGTSDALNEFDNPADIVKVLKWFNDFWVFLEIKFTIEEKKVINKRTNEIYVCFSLSIFQGENSDNKKYQLFRAEWDDYNNTEEKHSQPHWHITSNQALEKTIEEYADIFDNRYLISLLDEERNKVFDVKRIHFAMNGNWQNDETHIHKMENEQQIAKWLQGMLNHLRIELDSQ